MNNKMIVKKFTMLFLMLIFALSPTVIRVKKIEVPASSYSRTETTTAATATEPETRKLPEASKVYEESKKEQTCVVLATSYCDDSAAVYYAVPLTAGIQDMIRMCCKKWDLEPKLVYAVIQQESDFNPDCYYDGNYGLMQINKCNFGTYGIVNPYDVTENLCAGIQILGTLWAKYGSYHETLMSYNMGEAGAKAKWSEGIYNTSYSRSVMNHYANICECERSMLNE